jgi:integrase
MGTAIAPDATSDLGDHEFDLALTEEQRREMNTLEQLRMDSEAMRLGLSSGTLIREAIEVNHRQTGSKETLRDYEKDLEHFAAYLESVWQRNPYTAQRKHITMFLNHLSCKGGESPDPSRKSCSWCRERSYPDGRGRDGWSPSTIKGALSAVRFLYHHFNCEEDLPNGDPSHTISGPKITNQMQWAPTEDEVRALLAAPGQPTDKLLVYWLYYAPSRVAPLREARWADIDLDEKTWTLIGKGGKPDQFELHDKLVRVFKEYRKWVLKRAANNPEVEAALENDDTAYVLLTRTGKPFAQQQIAKMIKRRAVRGGVAVKACRPDRNNCDGKTSKISPHTLRRAWARHALNAAAEPVPIDVVSEVLRHKDISTTRRHYAQTKPQRAQDAIRNRKL